MTPKARLRQEPGAGDRLIDLPELGIDGIPRDVAIVLLRIAGLSYGQLGQRFGLTADQAKYIVRTKQEAIIRECGLD